MAGIEEEHAVETFKSIIQISLVGLKLLALFNGGAAVAVLAYLGNVAGKDLPVPSMWLPMLCFVMGLIFCGGAFLAGYFTQVFLYNESTKQMPAGRHHRYQIVAIICAVLSLAGFSVGACLAAWSFR